MKSRPGNKYLLAVLLFSFFVTGIPAGNSENIDTGSKEKKLAQTRKIRTEGKLLWELRQLKKAEAALPGTDPNLRSKAEMEILVKIRMLQSGKRLPDPQLFADPEAEINKNKITAKNERSKLAADEIKEIRAAGKAIINTGPKPASGSGSISGRVTNASGVGIEGIYVGVYNLERSYSWMGLTNASGNYTVPILPSGDFKVDFYDFDGIYSTEWYNDKSIFATADQVTVSSGSDTPGIDAQLAHTGRISGRVTDASGVGIRGIYIKIYDLDNKEYYIKYGFTDYSGNYTISGLSAGSFKVYFDNNGKNYVAEWYNGKSSFETADPVAVTSDSTTTDINARLAAGGQISGRVTASSGEGISGISVQVWDLVDDYLSYATTDSSGNYTAWGLPGGSFKVSFYDNPYSNGYIYTEEWYNDKSSFATADPVVVTAGSTTANIDAQLATIPPQISGRVTNASGVGIQNIKVVASYYSAPMDPPDIWVGFTDAGGNYSISGIFGSPVTVFFDRNGQNYVSEAFPNEVVVIAGGTASSIDAQLAMGGQISGQVTNVSAVGIQGIWVYAYDLDRKWIEYSITDASGNYTVSGLPAGNCKVRFSHGSTNYVSEWYNNKSSFETADQVAVIAGGTTTGINAQLAVEGIISGRVTNSSGVGISGILVSVSDLAGQWIEEYNFSDANGNYTVPGMPAGNLKIYFNNYDNNGRNYVSEWYNDKNSFAAADPVTVIAGSTTAHIDAQLAVGGSISGRVTNASGAGIKDVIIYVYDLAGHSMDLAYPDYYTDTNGNYTASGLPSGSFKVRFSADNLYKQNYLSEWFNDKSSFETADLVAVIAGSTTVNIEAQLAAGGQITGWVTSASGAVVYSRVYVYDLDNNLIGEDLVDTNTRPYAVSGLPSGNYKVFFHGSGQFLSEWYSDKNSFAIADPVALIAGSTITINAQLATAPSHAITVIFPNGGENWNSGDVHNITWSSSGTIARVNIDYSIDSGSNWMPVAVYTTNDGSYAWTVPATLSATCLIRVSEAYSGNPSDISNGVFSISASTAETVSTPSQPSGANSGMKDSSYSFSSGGSTSNSGHALQYRFDWDDGQTSGWLPEGITVASYAWTINDTYHVRAMARCVTHPDIESLWSEPRAITISDSGTLGKYNSPAQQKILPEAIWTAATGGGTWITEVQITDLSGGSQVSVYYNTTAGRRGPFPLWNNNSGALRSQKYNNLLQTIDGLDSDVFTYYGTLGAVEFITQDAGHMLQVTARTSNGNYSKTLPTLSLHDANTADTSRAMVIPNLTNNNTYRSTYGLFNPTADLVTLELKLFDSVNTQIGSTITKTINGYGFSADSPFNEAGRPYPAYSYDNVIMKVQPVSGSGKVFCFGASANNVTNDPAAHIAVQNGTGYDNGPNSLQILPEAIWAPATGGGTWMSEAQIVDVTGGSIVSVYSNYGGGSRRGPFVLETGSGAGSKVKYTNILQQLGTIDSSFSYFGWVGALEFQTQDSSHQIQVTTRTLNGNFSKTFPGLNLVDAETADTSRMMLIQNLTNNSAYRSTCGFYNPTADPVAVEFTLLNADNAQIGIPFSKTFVGYDFQAFSPFNDAGVPYPANTYDNVILRVRPTSGSGQVACFGASANNASNDPAAHPAVQGQ